MADGSDTIRCEKTLLMNSSATNVVLLTMVDWSSFSSVVLPRNGCTKKKKVTVFEEFT